MNKKRSHVLTSISGFFERKSSLWKNLGWILVAVLVIGWIVNDTQFNVVELVKGRSAMFDFISGMFPMNFINIGKYLLAMLQTIEIAVLGTVIGILFSIPISMLAARNISPHPVLYTLSRFFLNGCRAINEMIFALVFVTAVGLGPFPGVLALAVHTIGKLGKFYAEAIENIDRGPMEALGSTGAGRLQIFRFSIFPQIFPEFITFSLYQWESNVRSSTILGLVGAGGIGLELISSMRLFEYQDTSTILLIILLTVIIVDFVSSRIRARVI